MQNPLAAPVERFVATLTPVLLGISRGVHAEDDPERLRADVVLEAANLVAAFIDADGRQSDDELWAYIAAFGPRLPTLLRNAGPADVRRAGVINGKASWIAQPSALVEILVSADRRGGTAHARTYYDGALELAHVVVALDDYPSPAELDALERLRTTLLTATGPVEVPFQDPTAAPTPAAQGEVPAPSPALPPEPPRPLDELLAELDALVGLEPVKKEVKRVAALIRVQKLRAERGLQVHEASRHLVFTGNPGTGKTTVARLLAQIYRTLEVVAKGHLVETDRAGLVAGFVGQTAPRVVEAFDRADEGVLLIDEAYALTRGGQQDFGREAVDTLVKLLEDRRDRLVVIVAGYPEEMVDFIDSNPGLRSRFPRTVHFPDYSDDELVAIVASLCDRSGYLLTDGARQAVRSLLAKQERSRGFGNGRLARNLFEETIARQAERLIHRDDPSTSELQTLTAADIPEQA